MHTTRHLKTIPAMLLVGSLVVSLSGCIIHVGGNDKDRSRNGHGVSSVFGDVEVSKGKQVGDVSSVNGDIELHQNVTAQDVDTVNGSLEFDANVSVYSAKTVNGDIEIKHHFQSMGKVETVNGDIEIDHDSVVEDDIETVNGDIQLNQVDVNGSLITYNGDIKLLSQSHVKGDIRFAKNNNRKQYSKPTLRIEKGSTVDGDIILEKEVKLDIDDANLLRKVQYRFKAL